MSDISSNPARELRDYGSLLRRRWPWLVLGLLIGAVAGLGYLRVATPTYVSTAKVQVYSVTADTTSIGERTSGPVNLDDEAQLVQSEEVAAKTAESLGSSMTPVQLSRRVVVTVPPNTTVLNISYAAQTPAEAQEGAQAFAEAYLAKRAELAQAQVDERVALLSAQIRDAQSRLQKVIGALNDPQVSPTERDQLLATRLYIDSQITALNNELVPLQANVIDPGVTIFAAQLPSRPQDPNPLLILPSGILAGLLLGLGMALLRERTDRRLHSHADVERVFGLPVLARLDPRKSSVTALMSGAPVDHEIRALFHNIESVTDENVKVVLVAAPASSQSVGEITRALALVAARTGARTSYLTRLSGSDALLSAAWQRFGRRGDLQIANYGDLGVMVEGELHSSALIATLKRMRRDRQFVVMDLPSGDAAIDIPVIARHADVVLVAVELGRTSRMSVNQTLALLARSGASNVFGISISRSRRRSRRVSAAPPPGLSEPLAQPAEDQRLAPNSHLLSPGRRETSRSATGAESAGPRIK